MARDGTRAHVMIRIETLRLALKSLSGSKTKGKSLFRTPPQNTTNPQVRSGVFENSAHHFTSLENAPFGIICSSICSSPETPFPSLGNERRLKP